MKISGHVCERENNEVLGDGINKMCESFPQRSEVTD